MSLTDAENTSLQEKALMRTELTQEICRPEFNKIFSKSLRPGASPIQDT